MTATDRHFRAHAREEVRVRIRWRRFDEPHAQEIEAHTRNIGVGGAFIVTEAPPAVGTTIVVVIASPATWEPVLVHGEVRWTTRGNGPEDAGMGIAFRELAARDVVAMHDFFVALEFKGDE